MKKKEAIKKENNPFPNPGTDPQGRDTGVPEQPGERPVQDADDL